MCVLHQLHRSIGSKGRQPKFFEKDLAEDELVVHGAAQFFIWERVRQKAGVRPEGGRRRFAYFLAEEKVGRRRLNRLTIRCQLSLAQRAKKNLSAPTGPTKNGSTRRKAGASSHTKKGNQISGISTTIS